MQAELSGHSFKMKRTKFSSTLQANKPTSIWVLSLPDTDCSVPKDLAQGSSQPKPSRRSAEYELDHLPSFQNRCKLDTLLALVFQHPAGKQTGTEKVQLL